VISIRIGGCGVGLCKCDAGWVGCHVTRVGVNGLGTYTCGADVDGVGVHGWGGG
jgi:hypothetical protein